MVICLLFITNSIFSQPREIHTSVDKNGAHVTEIKEVRSGSSGMEKPGNPRPKDIDRQPSASSASPSQPNVIAVPAPPTDAFKITLSWIKQMQNHLKTNKAIKTLIGANPIVSLLTGNPIELASAISLMIYNGDVEGLPATFKGLDDNTRRQLEDDATGAELELEREIHEKAEKKEPTERGRITLKADIL